VKPITHEAISASAGSGKTFQLAHRYIRLLAGGVKPERIIALTFSRKAAGEIFDSIITYLYRAATSPETARTTSEIIDIPSLCQNDFLRLLREMMNSLHRLQIGTLDSFTVGIIRSFPMELGISGAFQVMESEGALARTARQEVLGRIFNHHYVNQTTQREFLEALNRRPLARRRKGCSATSIPSSVSTTGSITPCPTGTGGGSRPASGRKARPGRARWKTGARQGSGYVS